MNGNPDISQIASILADSSRAEILNRLMDGRFHTAGELALAAKIKPQTASFHLTKLTQLNLVKMEKHGRFRYYQLASEEIARVIESLLTISPPKEVRSFKQDRETKVLCRARTCYDHLAGRLGTMLTASLVSGGHIRENGDQFEVTPEGERFFTELGLNLNDLRKKRRSFSRICLDWSERRHHLAGALGSALTALFFEKGWIHYIASTRALEITDAGKKGFKQTFNLEL